MKRPSHGALPAIIRGSHFRNCAAAALRPIYTQLFPTAKLTLVNHTRSTYRIDGNSSPPVRHATRASAIAFQFLGIRTVATRRSKLPSLARSASTRLSLLKSLIRSIEQNQRAKYLKRPPGNQPLNSGVSAFACGKSRSVAKSAVDRPLTPVADTRLPLAHGRLRYKIKQFQSAFTTQLQHQSVASPGFASHARTFSPTLPGFARLVFLMPATRAASEARRHRVFRSSQFGHREQSIYISNIHATFSRAFRSEKRADYRGYSHTQTPGMAEHCARPVSDLPYPRSKPHKLSRYVSALPCRDLRSPHGKDTLECGIQYYGTMSDF